MDDKKKNPTEDYPPQESRQMIAVPIECLPLCNSTDDEIDLRELLAILKKRKWLITATAALVIGFGILYAFFLAKPIYEARATIIIGHQLFSSQKDRGAILYFGNCRDLKQYLDSLYGTSGKYRPNNADAYISKVLIPENCENCENYLTIVAQGKNNSLAIKALHQPLEDVLNKHKKFYDAILQNKKDAIALTRKKIFENQQLILPQLETRVKILQEVNLKQLEDKITFLKTREIPALLSKISHCKREVAEKRRSIKQLLDKPGKLLRNDAALAAMTAMKIARLQEDLAKLQLKIIDFQARTKEIKEQEIPKLRDQRRQLVDQTIPQAKAKIIQLTKVTIPTLQTEISQLERETQAPYLVKTTLLGEIQSLGHPVKPRKKLILALAGIVGLMLGIFLALTCEFSTSFNDKKN